MTGARHVAAARRRGWVAFAVPPVAWMGQLLVMYLLVPFACEEGRAPLLVTTAVALLAAVGAIVVGRGTGRGRDEERGIAGVGRIQGWVFVFGILGAGAAAVWLDPCA